MGKIILTSNVTLDGVVQDPDGAEGFAQGGWFHQFVGAKDLEDWTVRETQEALDAEVLLLGGRTNAWFADRMTEQNLAEGRVSPEWANRVRSMPKYVVSSTLDAPRWSNVSVLGGDAVKEVSELKQKVDGEILIYASYQLARTLIEHNLLDELRLVVFPVVVGSGLRLFDEICDKKPLHLVDTRKMGEGLVFYSYEVVQA
ncbi:dihydrofolate reductase family protein [Nocardia sp. NEAU-G5]|uniref:Dihydrofolate reductase family protein n=1 Tax=Nocardia albiluteola TaxID=2842303 RepID=A0ABS6AQH3_9NOCA|nr:dihydrofolate reductase family protein [Nocardia albiluteola]MBU3060267.1 dihydrofolate reductase family protein [Nocardia albiluteola]